MQQAASVVDLSVRDAAVIKNLIEGVASSNAAQTIAELRQQIGATFEAHRFAIGQLFADVVSKHESAGINVLSGELQEALERSNSTSLLADGLDNISGSIQVDALHELLRIYLRLKPREQFAVAASFCFAHGQDAQHAGKKLLQRLLSDYQVRNDKKMQIQKIKDLAAVLTLDGTQGSQLKQLIGFLISSDPSLCDAEFTAKFVSAVAVCEIPDFVTPGVEGGPKAALRPHAGTLAGLMEEVGPICCSQSLEDFKDFLTVAVDLISPLSVAHCIGLLASPTTPPSDPHALNALFTSNGKAHRTFPHPLPSTWELKHFVQGMKDVGPQNLSWDEVLRSIGKTHSPRLEKFVVVPSIYRKATGSPLPLQLFLGRWENRHAQGAALRWILGNAPTVNCAIEGQDPALFSDIATPSDLNHLWKSVGFVESMIHVAEIDRDAETTIQQISERAPKCLFAAILCSTGLPHSQVISLLLSILRAAGPSVVAPPIVAVCEKKGAISVLLNTLMCYAAGAEFAKCNEIVNVLHETGLLVRSFAHAKTSKMLAFCAIRARSANIIPAAWFTTALQNTSEGIESLANRTALATSLVEAIDELFSQSPPQYSEGATAALEAVANAEFAPSIQSVVAYARQLQAAGTPAPSSTIDTETTEFYRKMYGGDASAEEAGFEQLSRLHQSNTPHDIQLFDSVTNLLWEETQAISNYPKRELRIAARLFGRLLNSSMLTVQRLQSGLRIVLQLLAKPTDTKALEYAIEALNQFKRRLHEWPAYCNLLKQLPDLDMYIPGIVATMNRGMQYAAMGTTQQQQGPIDTERNKPATTALQDLQTPGSLVLHQHDIRILMGHEEIEVPPGILQDRLNFVVGNTDPSNVQENAQELALLLQPQFYKYFANYLVVKRISLEANFHRMYLSLLEMIKIREVDRNVRDATINSIKRVLVSDKIRVNSSERTLLKNLGSWLGMCTLGRNLPVLATELDLREMLFAGLQEGKLIAIVPFIAKLLEQAKDSRIFRPPNPWLMSMLGMLVEIYSLSDLKMTLRFEVEVLCKNLGVQMSDVPPPVRRPGRSLIEVRRTLDVSNSTDFRVEEPLPQPPSLADLGKASKLHPGARPYEPRDEQSGRAGSVPGYGGSPSPQMRFTSESVRVGAELQVISPSLRAAYRSTLPALLDRTLQEMVPAIERSVVIAATTTKEVALKDFTRDPDDAKLHQCAQQMVRCLASSLCMITVKDLLRMALKKHLSSALPQFVPDSSILGEVVEGVIRENCETCYSMISAETCERASRKVEELLSPALDERMKSIRSNEFPAVPPDQARVTALLAMMPETLRPLGTLLPQHRAVYDEFVAKGERTAGTSAHAIEQVIGLLQQIDHAATRHYQLLPPTSAAQVLSLTSSAFTETTQSEYHTLIKSKLLEISQLITETTAVPLVQAIFPKLMVLAESMASLDPRTLTLQSCVNVLLVEACLFVMQAARERGQARPVKELTRLYLAHERRWHVRDIVISLIRLHVIDIHEFDAALANALQTEQSTPGGRHIVEFAGRVVQCCLIDEKLASTKELKLTLEMLERIAKRHSVAQHHAAAETVPATLPAPAPSGGDLGPVAVAQSVASANAQGQGSRPLIRPGSVRINSMYPAEHRPRVQTLFNEWGIICQRRMQMAEAGTSALDPAHSQGQPQQPTPQQLSMQFVAQLQQEGMLKPDGTLDRFLGLLMELSVEDYCTRVAQLETEGGGESSQAASSGAKPPISGSGITQPPPNRLPSDTRVFQASDAFSDLVTLLIRCCAWNPSQRDGNAPRAMLQAEVALVTKVLSIVTKVMHHNHDSLAETQKATLPPPPDEGVWQDAFQQRPYLRFFSNLILAVLPHQPDEAGGTSNNEILAVFANTFHINNPQRLPAFAFAWLDLIGHRIFVSRALKNQHVWPGYCRLLCDALRFVEPYVRSGDVPPPMLVFFKSLLKLSLVLLHDFPDFVMAYHQPLCDAIPTQCVQLRNVILTAFPRHTRLPDPFGLNLKLSQLPEITQPPPIADGVRDYFVAQAQGSTGAQPPAPPGGIHREALQLYLQTRRPADFVAGLLQRVRNTGTPVTTSTSTTTPLPSTKWNISVLNNLVLTTATLQLELTPAAPVTETTAFELFKEFAVTMDNEGRYYLLNAFANQLRFPNSHTQFFSAAILSLFLHPCPVQEILQEQITRVLVERVIITRPHPWGLLATFIELVRNNRYDIWSKPFIRCTPQIEATFETVGRSILGVSSGAAPASSHEDPEVRATKTASA